MVMVINSQKAVDSLYNHKVKLGGDASVALGPKGAGTNGSINADFILHAKTKGAFAGIAVYDAVVEVREKLNAAYYGKPVPPVEVLVRGTASNPGSDKVQAALKQAAK